MLIGSLKISVPNSPTSLFKMGANSSEVGPIVIDVYVSYIIIKLRFFGIIDNIAFSLVNELLKFS